MRCQRRRRAGPSERSRSTARYHGRRGRLRQFGKPGRGSADLGWASRTHESPGAYFPARCPRGVESCAAVMAARKATLPRLAGDIGERHSDGSAGVVFALTACQLAEQLAPVDDRLPMTAALHPQRRVLHFVGVEEVADDEGNAAAATDEALAYRRAPHTTPSRATPRPGRVA